MRALPFLLVLAAVSVEAAPPRIGGVCLTCPSWDFGPFTPAAAWQTHDSTLVGSNDCAWYSFNVVAGNAYEFATCPPGAAAWDTVLELYDPSASCTIPVASADGGCAGAATRLAWDATYTGSVHLKLKGAGTATGAFTLAYRSIPCLTCPQPGATLDADCECASGTTTPSCPSAVYRVNASGGEFLTVTTCAAICPSAAATFDSVIRLLNWSCTTRLAGNDDGCTHPGMPRSSTLVYRPPSTGVYLLEVTGGSLAGGGVATGDYTVCRSRCELVPGVWPASGSAEPASCSRTVDFLLSAGPGAVLPVSYDWEITPVPGGAAVPPRGTVTSSAPSGAATFRTRLTGLGDHEVQVLLRNVCRITTTSTSFRLQDTTRPFVLAPPGSTVECPSAPPPATPRVRDNCDASPEVVLTETMTPGPCPNAYSVRRTWVATDDSGNASAPARQVVNVVDRTAPVVTPDTTVAHCAFPPDHGRACFTFADFTPIAADACPGPISWIFARVTHDEEGLGACDPPDGDPDVELAPDGSSFCVRAERCVDDPAASIGRRYLVEAIARDACGNASPVTPIASVLIPQDSADTSACRVPAPW